MGSKAVRNSSELSHLAVEMIERSVPEQCPIKSLVVFPKAETLLIPRPLGHFKCVALMRLVDDTIWMLTIPGRAWTSHRLHVAANVLCRISEDAYAKGSVELLLRQELGIESISLEQLVIGSVDVRQWGVQEVAFALNKRIATTRRTTTYGVSNVELRLSSIETALIGGLEEGLQDFDEGMEPRAREIASASGRFNQRLYNYLAHTAYRRFRLQFAETFPSLLLTSVLAERGTLGAELRSIVDSGAPLIKCLAGRWNVRPGVVRHLVGKLSSHVGVQWSRDAMGLALTLNALRPEDLPGNNANAWSEFNHTVAVGQRLFCRPIWESAAGLEWLRECVNRGKRGTKTSLELWLPDWAEVTSIVRFRDALTRSLRRELADSDAHSANNVAGAVVEAVDWLVLEMASVNLVEIAARFDDELDRARRESQVDKVVSGEIMWPLIPTDFTSGDGTRVIRPLTTSMQLRFHGRDLNNCLDRGGAQYIRKGSTGMNFIVGVFNKNSGKALSTAEIAVRPRKDMLTYGFVVKQHAAKNNARPSPQCTQAVADLLRFCRTDEIRGYLEDSWQKIHHRYRKGRRGRNPELEAIARKALKQTLTDKVYEETLARVRG